MRSVISLLLICLMQAIHAECMKYSDESIFHGVLVRQVYPEQPNYDDLSKGDAAASYFFIILHSPVCVQKGENELDVAEQKITRLQLAFPRPKESYEKLSQFINAKIECRGHIFHAITGHHHSNVLLSEAVCVP